MEQIVKNNIVFNNVPNTPAKGYTCLITNVDNVSNNRYKYDPDSDPIISALDINWCGIQPDANHTINTTDELISWIKENNGMNKEQEEIISTCKNLLFMIKDYLSRNTNDDPNNRFYWYAGPNQINALTMPGSDSDWHIIPNNDIINIETGELSNENKINWVIAIPTLFGLNHISNGEDITDAYDIEYITCANNVEYTVFTQIQPTKRIDVTIFQK